MLGQTRFEIGANSFSKINAWWMAELCRLIYREEADEERNAQPPTRRQALDEVQLEEVEFFNEGDTEAALIKPKGSAAAQFAALVFRGTTDLKDWLTDFEALPSVWAGRGQVHAGFAKALGLVWDEVAAFINQNVNGNCPLFIAGHGLGAALAAWRRPHCDSRARFTHSGLRELAIEILAQRSRASTFSE